jgi:hypothetical protein
MDLFFILVIRHPQIRHFHFGLGCNLIYFQNVAQFSWPCVGKIGSCLLASLKLYRSDWDGWMETVGVCIVMSLKHDRTWWEGAWARIPRSGCVARLRGSLDSSWEGCNWSLVHHRVSCLVLIVWTMGRHKDNNGDGCLCLTWVIRFGAKTKIWWCRRFLVRSLIRGNKAQMQFTVTLYNHIL